MESPRLRQWAAALVLVLCGVMLHADEAEDKAVQAVEKWGGTVTRDEKKPGKPVIGVDLRVTKVTDGGLKEFKDLKALQTLNLFGTQVTDAGLKELKELKSLQTLGLNDTQVTDAGLKELRQTLPQCQFFH